MNLSINVFLLVCFTLCSSHSFAADWFNVKGRVQIDHDSTQLNGKKVINETNYRRVWLSVYGDKNDWGYLARFDLRAETFDADGIVDLVATYSGFDNGSQLILGRQKTHFGLNWASGNTSLSFTERGGVANYHKYGRMEGVTYQAKLGDKINYWLGFYDKNDFKGNAAIGRITYSYFVEPSHYYHLGSGLGLTGEKDLANIEFAYGYSALHLQSEYFVASYEDDTQTDTNGWYVEAGYFLDGQTSRPYREGKFRRVKTNAAFGVLQVTMRAEQGDGNFNHVNIGKSVDASVYTLGLNWYIPSSVL
ncbi:hypothetical protein C2869_07855 [Saccharobesus litoralis]|uniref:Porin n=1 Tax=Saccharobesus litoralis TaxID=2172099 RepID=A0A2S0VQ93_9ALTE|nr:porin [Saccharobesus litoralis]AWB66352.1 hypothetical protein C2869_07855 [Saccharobesus litoralis]